LPWKQSLPWKFSSPWGRPPPPTPRLVRLCLPPKQTLNQEPIAFNKCAIAITTDLILILSVENKDVKVWQLHVFKNGLNRQCTGHNALMTYFIVCICCFWVCDFPSVIGSVVFQQMFCSVYQRSRQNYFPHAVARFHNFWTLSQPRLHLFCTFLCSIAVVADAQN